jgi:hypothetical protein
MATRCRAVRRAPVASMGSSCLQRVASSRRVLCCAMQCMCGQGRPTSRYCLPDRGHGEWLASSGLSRGEMDPSIRTGEAAKGRMISQKPTNTVFVIKKHGWRGGEGGRLDIIHITLHYYITLIPFNKHIEKKQGTSAKRLLHQTCKFQIENRPP